MKKLIIAAIIGLIFGFSLSLSHSAFAIAGSAIDSGGSGIATPVSVANGGTGVATHTANSVLIGNTTSAITSIAPSTNGNVLTSNGTTWSSAAPAAGVLASGALVCGAGTAGKAQVHTTPLQYCDNAATPALQYSAYGESDGDAAVSSALRSATTVVSVSSAIAPSIGQVLTATSGAAAEWQTPAAGVTGFTSALNTAAPNVSTNVSSLTASGGTTNQDAVLAPKGTGALIAQIPTASAAGGAKRGDGATDWSRSRGATAQVASGTSSTLSGGSSNTAGGMWSTVCGGYVNAATGSESTTCGGRNNTASGNNSTTIGGYNNSVSGGQYSINAGGANNVVTGSYATSTGSNNTIAGSNAFVSGDSNTVNSQFSTIPGGHFGSTRGLVGRLSFASDGAALGTSQMGIHVTRAATTDAAVAYLATGGVAPAATTVNVLTAGYSYLVRADVIAVQYGGAAGTVGDTKGWSITAVAKRLAAGNVVIVSSTVATAIGDAAASAWVADVVAVTAQQAVEVQVTGEVNKSIRWVATMYTTEVL